MDPIFGTYFSADTISIGVCDANDQVHVFTPLPIDDETHAIVEAPVEIGVAQGWTRRGDLEAHREAAYAELGEQMKADMDRADSDAAARAKADAERQAAEADAHARADAEAQAKADAERQAADDAAKATDTAQPSADAPKTGKRK